MKIIIKDVGYNRGYVIGPYLQERPGVNADVVVEEGEDQEECALKALRYLKSITDKFHKEDNPHLYEESRSTHFHGLGPVPENQIPSPMPIIDKRWEEFEINIDNAQTPEALEELIKQHETFPAKFIPAINAKRQSFKL